MDMSNIKSLFIIVNAGHADEVIEIARAAGAGGATVFNARGEGGRHEVVLGITLDEEKEIILCLADEKTAGNVMTAVTNKAGIKTPAHSVCFTMSVDKIIGITTSALPRQQE